MKRFVTYQPATITPNGIDSPCVFNGFCLIRRYKVTVEEVEESPEVLKERLRNLWDRRQELRITHGLNMSAMQKEASILGIELK